MTQFNNIQRKLTPNTIGEKDSIQMAKVKIDNLFRNWRYEGFSKEENLEYLEFLGKQISQYVEIRGH